MLFVDGGGSMEASMSYFWLCAAVFFLAYLANIFFITVFYHRGITHGAVRLTAKAEKWAVHLGNWITGIDPKAWACMHRMHHQYSDTPQDPHSPVHMGVFPVILAQLRSYEKALRGLIREKPQYTSVVSDLKFPVSWLNRRKLWFLPYVLHGSIALGLGIFAHAWALGACYYLGMMTHPIQGWMVNALAHAYGYRNFATPDNSKNNSFVAWLVMGEGFQNNHHQSPSSAKFSVKWWEVDMGYGLCQIAKWLGWIEFSKPAVKDSL